MASKKRERDPRLTSPMGVARFPFFVKPSTKFNPKGEYGTKLVVPHEDAADYIEKLEHIRDEFIRKLEPKDRKNLIVAPVYQPDLNEDGEETGNAVFKYKIPAKIEAKDGTVYDMKPRLVDSRDRPIEDKSLSLYSGSVLRIIADVRAYHMPATRTAGVSLRPRAVQIIKLVKGGAGGFGTVEGGYAHEPDDDDDDDPQDDDDDSSRY